MRFPNREKRAGAVVLEFHRKVQRCRSLHHGPLTWAMERFESRGMCRRTFVEVHDASADEVRCNGRCPLGGKRSRTLPDPSAVRSVPPTSSVYARFIRCSSSPNRRSARGSYAPIPGTWGAMSIAEGDVWRTDRLRSQVPGSGWSPQVQQQSHLLVTAKSWCMTKRVLSSSCDRRRACRA